MCSRFPQLFYASMFIPVVRRCHSFPYNERALLAGWMEFGRGENVR
jgi:hypothetical protein